MITKTDREKRIKELEDKVSELEMRLYGLEMRAITHPVSVPYAPPVNPIVTPRPIIYEDNNTGTPLPKQPRTIC